jgi:phage baseplate assembly protein W
MEIKENFFGKGWSFPPSFNKTAGLVNMVESVEDINQSLHILLSTITGERIMQPKYGCDMNEFVFEPVTTTLRTVMTDKIKTALLIYEPRIEVEKVEIDSEGELEGKVLINVHYKVRTTNSRYNYVFPFYKAEATELKTTVE